MALNSMTQERNALRDTTSRLQAERDILKRHQNAQQVLRLNLEEIKNGLELSNSALKTKMETDIDNLRRENAILRRKVKKTVYMPCDFFISLNYINNNWFNIS